MFIVIILVIQEKLTLTLSYTTGFPKFPFFAARRIFWEEVFYDVLHDPNSRHVDVRIVKAGRRADKVSEDSTSIFVQLNSCGNLPRT